jgi:hypothetical protein
VITIVSIVKVFNEKIQRKESVKRINAAPGAAGVDRKRASGRPARRLKLPVATSARRRRLFTKAEPAAVDSFHAAGIPPGAKPAKLIPPVWPASQLSASQSGPVGSLPLILRWRSGDAGISLT